MSASSITLHFADEATANYVRLVCTRKSITLEDYVLDNFEWDDQPYCFSDEVTEITSEVCDGCEYLESCPDGIP